MPADEEKKTEENFTASDNEHRGNRAHPSAISRATLCRALEEPLRQIAQNAGHEGVLVVGRVRESKDEKLWLQRGDLVKAGVIDPAKVTRLSHFRTLCLSSH